MPFEGWTGAPPLLLLCLMLFVGQIRWQEQSRANPRFRVQLSMTLANRMATLILLLAYQFAGHL